ncbi:MAG: STAS domain-containing protein [bacterium]|nr:STAS domain-containing protein [bacterium]
MFEISRLDPDTVVLNGRLDAASASAARNFLDDIESTCRLDFTELEYIASVGLGLLASVQKRLMATGDGLILANLSPHLREVLTLAGFEGIFEFE